MVAGSASSGRSRRERRAPATPKIGQKACPFWQIPQIAHAAFAEEANSRETKASVERAWYPQARPLADPPWPS